MKTTHGLCHHSIDLITAAMGWVEMNEKGKSKKLLMEAIGQIQEACHRLDTLMKDLEPIADKVELERTLEDHPDRPKKPEGGSCGPKN